MKVRTGFVSNSSSSSFIVGIGVVTDFKKFNNWMGKLNPNDAEYIDLVDYREERKQSYGRINENSSSFSVEEPTNYGGSVSLSKEAYEKIASERPDNIVALCLGNNEGDSAFCPEDDYEPNYDIDLYWFSEGQQELFDGFGEENGISLVDKTYGAGRNG